MEQHQVHVWENTFQMGPKDDQVFLPSRITKIVEEIIDSKLKDKEYQEAEAKQWVLELCNEIKAGVKEGGGIPRHKIIVQVIIGENAGQGIRVASKSLWDTNVDNWASFSYDRNPTMLVTGMVFGLYYE